ncbi:unnamed protein product [Caenorhabditis bovis]|uniref:CID domain-containing protein n=1 Tax=Caenorhabditis bovis TaxID=2654633 RepID=A0A8S1EQR3_9PELO|nr:unnamed protein product [Caenorhabditis bovis]
MDQFTENNLKQRLATLTNQQESILSLSKWLQANYQNREIIISIWLKELRKQSNTSQIINLLYLANDIAQNTRKWCPQYKTDFFPAIENAFKHASRLKSTELEKALTKLAHIWKDREIYSASQLKKLSDILSQKKMSASFPTPVNDPNPQINHYIEEEVKKNAQDVLMALKRLQNPPSTEREIRVVLSQFPESISCPEKLQTVRSSAEAQELLKKNEEALPLLEDYVKRLKDETHEREDLQSMLESLIQNVRLSVEHQEKLLKEVKRKEDRLKSDLLEVERSFESLPDLTAEMPVVEAPLPSLDKLFDL